MPVNLLRLVRMRYALPLINVKKGFVKTVAVIDLPIVPSLPVFLFVIAILFFRESDLSVKAMLMIPVRGSRIE